MPGKTDVSVPAQFLVPWLLTVLSALFAWLLISSVQLQTQLSSLEGKLAPMIQVIEKGELKRCFR
jgi:hypothetical protein